MPVKISDATSKNEAALRVLTFLLFLSWTKFSSAVIVHCDPDTDTKREKALENLPRMKEFLESDFKVTAGRLGTLHFVNWQDKLFHLKAPGKKECRWRMRSKIKKEEDIFNGNFYVSPELNADPISSKNYYRLVSCEREDCVQFFNVFMRPITKPEFPVQIYEGYKRDVQCTLETMHDEHVKHSPRLSDHNPPYRFEWTGPTDCLRKNWNVDKKDKDCMRYTSYDPSCATSKGCSFKIDKLSYTNPNQTSTPTDYGYENTLMKIEGKTMKDREGKNVDTQTQSTLSIQSAKKTHGGEWRCIVYDAFDLSSHPDEVGQADLDHQEIIHRGILVIRIKNLIMALGIPAAITVVVIIWSLICMNVCKECTDFKDDQGEEEPELEVIASLESSHKAKPKPKEADGAGVGDEPTVSRVASKNQISPEILSPSKQNLEKVQSDLRLSEMSETSTVEENKLPDGSKDKKKGKKAGNKAGAGNKAKK